MRKKNPLFPPPSGPIEPPKRPKKKKPADGLTKKQREAVHAKKLLHERAKRMRPFFRDQFTASAGFDLRKVDSWTPAQKAKVTKYFRVIAPRITGDFVVKRYRRKDNLNAAIDASLQEKKLKGQTAVAFSVDPGERLDIQIRKGVATVKRNNFDEVKLKFDKTAFMKDPKAEIERVLNQTNAQVFRILTGGQKQNKVLARGDVMREIVSLVESYGPGRIRSDQGQRPFTDWLNGLVAYPGAFKKTYTALEKFVKNHKRVVDERRQNHLDELSAKQKGISVKQLRARRTKRMRAKGRQ